MYIYDSPVKKKRKLRKKESIKREYLIHIRKKDDKMVSAFSGNAWQVSLIIKII